MPTGNQKRRPLLYTDDLFEQTIVDVVQIGQIESGVEVFLNYSGSVTIERALVSAPTYRVTTSEMRAVVNGQSIYGVAYTPVGAGHGFNGGDFDLAFDYIMQYIKTN